MWWYPFLSDFTKKNNCLLTRRVCCFYQSNYCIRVCISHQSDCCIRVYISYWSDFFIRLCILHQSYHSIWISCTNYSAWVLFSCKWCHGIRGLCSKSGKWPQILCLCNKCHDCGLCKSFVKWGWDFWNMKGLQLFFCVPFLTWNLCYW